MEENAPYLVTFHYFLTFLHLFGICEYRQISEYWYSADYCYFHKNTFCHALTLRKLLTSDGHCVYVGAVLDRHVKPNNNNNNRWPCKDCIIDKWQPIFLLWMWLWINHTHFQT
uniref:Uncharacterized protein n=1 Tax=Glossina austeni TaxID=7395 RepID=A0A1A9USC4_GLOAU